jgi:hypothetical protein
MTAARLEGGVPFELLLSCCLILLFAITNFPSLILATVFIGFFVAIFLPFGRNVQYLIFLLPCLEVFTQSPYLSISLATLIFVAIFGRYLLTQLTYTQYYQPGIILLFLVMIFELIHTIYNPVMASAKTVRWLILFCFASLLIFDKNKYTSFSEIRFALLLGILVSTGYGLLHQYFFPVELYHDKAISRFSGGAGDPNNYGLYCLLLIYFYLPTIPRNRVTKTSFMVIALMLVFGSLTVSRSFFLVALMSLFLYCFLYFRSAVGDIFFRVLFSFGVVSLLVVVYLLSGQSFDINFAIFSRFGGDNLSELTGARSDIFKEYLRLFFELPMEFVLFGAGINGYLGYYNHSFAQTGLFPDVVGPHNTLLELLISFGMIGCLLFISYIFIAFKAEQNRTDNHQVFRIALLSVIVFLLYCFSLQNLGKYGSYFILMMIIYNTYRREL